MQKTKQVRKRNVSPVVLENKEFVKNKVRPLWPTFKEFHAAFCKAFPELINTPELLYHWMNVHALKCAARTDEVIALREFVKNKLQEQINDL